MSDSDAEISAETEMPPDFYKRLRKTNINLEKLIYENYEEISEVSFFDDMIGYIKHSLGKYFSRK